MPGRLLQGSCLDFQAVELGLVEPAALVFLPDQNNIERETFQGRAEEPIIPEPALSAENQNSGFAFTALLRTSAVA